MGRKFFGTDGIRGRTNVAPMTADTAMRVGQAAGAFFLRGDHRHRVVIGKDTRLSGYMMESAMVAGFTSVGMDVILVGPMPTPAVAMLTRELRADLGVMISASHNPFADNGIKLFGPDGYKLSDAAEMEIERLMEGGATLIDAPKIGRAKRIEDARGRYIHFAKSTFPDHLRLDGLKVVVDCANGAAYHVAPEALWELGAEVVALGTKPNGVYAITRHPMMWGFALWGVVHAIVNPTTASLILSATIVFLALVGAALQDGKTARLMGEVWRDYRARTSFFPYGKGLKSADAFALIGGTLLWLGATWAHGALGYRPAGIWALFG